MIEIDSGLLEKFSARTYGENTVCLEISLPDGTNINIWMRAKCRVKLARIAQAINEAFSE